MTSTLLITSSALGVATFAGLYTNNAPLWLYATTVGWVITAIIWATTTDEEQLPR